ncbi:hypothetical protein JB92DRAFT_3143693 [Gautieria morchelliformis]|nr:hypothetical protein JB92DRAFT_3143693 [Gautieria morchelliformis]
MIEAQVAHPGNVIGDPRPHMHLNDDMGFHDDREAERDIAVAGMRHMVTQEDEDRLIEEELEDYDAYAAELSNDLDDKSSPDDEDVTVPGAILDQQAFDLESVPLVELQSHLSGISQAGDWAPYPNKTMCLIDLLDNLPRLRLSRRHMEMFLWVMKECGAIDVPSQYV